MFELQLFYEYYKFVQSTHMWTNKCNLFLKCALYFDPNSRKLLSHSVILVDYVLFMLLALALWQARILFVR